MLLLLFYYIVKYTYRYVDFGRMPRKEKNEYYLQ